ncbi:hypothetical protein EMIT0158MI4_370006 [Burkholderia ambifaria]
MFFSIASATSMLKPGMKCALKAMTSCCSVGSEEYQPRKWSSGDSIFSFDIIESIGTNSTDSEVERAAQARRDPYCTSLGAPTIMSLCGVISLSCCFAMSAKATRDIERLLWRRAKSPVGPFGSTLGFE